MPNTDQPFRLNWASFAGERWSDTGFDLSIFVGDLAVDVTDAIFSSVVVDQVQMALHWQQGDVSF